MNDLSYFLNILTNNDIQQNLISNLISNSILMDNQQYFTLNFDFDLGVCKIKPHTINYLKLRSIQTNFYSDLYDEIKDNDCKKFIKTIIESRLLNNYSWKDPEYNHEYFYYITARYFDNLNNQDNTIYKIGYENKCYDCGYHLAKYYLMSNVELAEEIFEDCCFNDNIQAIKYYSQVLFHKNEKLKAINMCLKYAKKDSLMAFRCSNYISVYNYFHPNNNNFTDNDTLKWALFSYILDKRGYREIENKIRNVFHKKSLSKEVLLMIIGIIKNKGDLKIKKILDQYILMAPKKLIDHNSKIFYHNIDLVKKKYRKPLLQYHYKKIYVISDEMDLTFDISKKIYDYT